jgi:hypothetical protein
MLVCAPKDLGGLGIKDMGTQNICLLLKLIHKLHCPQSSAWAHWVQGRASVATLKGDIHGVSTRVRSQQLEGKLGKNRDGLGKKLRIGSTSTQVGRSRGRRTGCIVLLISCCWFCLPLMFSLLYRAKPGSEPAVAAALRLWFTPTPVH